MDIDPVALLELLESVCDRARHSVRQSTAVVIQQSHQRLSVVKYDSRALHVIAASSLVRQEPTRALDLLNRQGEGFSRDAVGNRLAGYAWLLCKDLSQARHCFDQAVRLDPNQSDCWNWLGQIAERDDQYTQAAEYYERGILFDQGDHESALALSGMQTRNRHLKDAIHTLRVCLIRDRRSPKLNLALARLLDRRASQLGRQRRFLAQQKVQSEALECYRIVNASAPTSDSLVRQGRVEQELEDFAAARDSFQKAVDRDPHSAVALCQLASVHVDYGQIETALPQFELSISIDPNRGETHFRYARAKKFKSDPTSQRYLEQLCGCLSAATGQPQKQIYLNFAIAKVYDDLGQYDRAWGHYEAANRLKMERRLRRISAPIVPIKASLRTESPRDVAESFSAEYFQSVNRRGHSSDRPIFIVGMPRSGTTLTEQILSSHPAIAGAGELKSIHQIQQLIVREHGNLGPDGVADGIDYPRLLAGRDARELCGYADQYLAKLESYRRDERHVTDKMPTNFLHLGLIATLFPNATVIHCRRDPMDVLVSCFCQNLNKPFCDMQQMVGYHRDYRAIMAHWEQVLPIKIFTNDYETLVADPENHARALIEHCGLPWDEACLNFYTNERAVHTPSKWQVRQPMYRSSVEKWRRFEKHLAAIADQIAAEIRTENGQGRSLPACGSDIGSDTEHAFESGTRRRSA